MSRWAPLLPSLGTLTAAHAADPLLFVYFKDPPTWACSLPSAMTAIASAL